ncbi:MAG TPA: maleylpyruvate isomerase N-terminal domain-containing protein, partial [Thermomicrobiales bacterium]|nr:maleylpyruvate isomerase N-terminal domain-containing protein [Thermomicrobiales bacterium]
MNRIERLIDKVETAWGAFHAAYADLPDEMLLISGVCGDWSIRDLIAHVTWWDAEALKHLPLVLAGGRPPRYADVYGGIDAFNALKTEEKRALSLEDVRREAVDTHA